ncbi:MAG: hypothetical protein OEW89_06440 [Gammaproteobacteria bacterium]|nr:hypothetical protein [Gammaproteobacteria bacterium]MDH5594161.1 hypothetical protein [Gammaproteobacteria bacterium]
MLETNVVYISQQSIPQINPESEETLEDILESLQEALGSLQELEQDIRKTGTSD